jgi:hypothetical protein
MYDLTKFSLSDMTYCGAALRKLGSGATSMEEVAKRIIQYFYESFVDSSTGDNAFVLARIFKTHAYANLATELQSAADKIVQGAAIAPTTKCLTLLATAGAQPAWNERTASQGHQAIPLVSEQLVAQSPMISQLIQQFGLEIATVLSPAPELLVDLEQRTYNVFHVPIAAGSAHVPAQQEFVIPYGVQSVLGFGGMLPSGDLMAVILFSKIKVERETADMFKTLALNVKMAMLPFDRGDVFA